MTYSEDEGIPSSTTARAFSLASRIASPRPAVPSTVAPMNAVRNATIPRRGSNALATVRRIASPRGNPRRWEVWMRPDASLPSRSSIESKWDVISLVLPRRTSVSL